MCNPGVIMAVGTGGAQAAGVIGQGRAETEQYKYAAAVADTQAQLVKRTAEQNISAVQTGAMYESEQLRKDTAQALGSQKAALAANGVGGGSVTSADIIKDTMTKADLDQMAIRYNADSKSWAIKTDADYKYWDLQNQSRQYQMAAKNSTRAMRLNTATSLLNSASSFVKNQSNGKSYSPSLAS